MGVRAPLMELWHEGCRGSVRLWVPDSLWWWGMWVRVLVWDALGRLSTREVADVFLRVQVQDASQLLAGRYPGWEWVVMLCSGVVVREQVQAAAQPPTGRCVMRLIRKGVWGGVRVRVLLMELWHERCRMSVRL